MLATIVWYIDAETGTVMTPLTEKNQERHNSKIQPEKKTNMLTINLTYICYMHIVI